MSTYRYARESLTPQEKNRCKYDTIVAQIADAERVLAWQMSEGYTEQAEYSRQAIAKLNARLAKLEA